MYFEYGSAETEYLIEKDARLAEVIGRIGHIYREADGDLFSSVVRHIIGQQISTKAQETVWRRMKDAFGEPDPLTVENASADELQSFGMSFRKAEYIKDLSRRIIKGGFDLDAVRGMDDADAIDALASLRGIGKWTAEMILLFCLQRPDILSYDDLAIRRGMRMVYRHRTLDRRLFDRYRRRLSPCGSVASLYFWAVAGGAIPGMKDPGQKNRRV